MTRKFLEWLLAGMARQALRTHKPKIIGITGSVGKTSVKEAIYAVLAAQFHGKVRKSTLNQNTEIGVTLTILGLNPAGRNPLKWLKELVRGMGVVFLTREYPDVVVLEMAADRPGDIGALVAIAPPDIAVVTAIGEVPVHVEYFAGPKTLAREKARLVEAVPPNGWVILNFDDLSVLEMRERTQAHVFTFGFGEGADVRAVAYEIRMSVDQHGKEIPEGISFKIEYAGNIVPVRLNDIFGKTAVYAALAAAAVGVAMKMHLVEVSEALANFVPPPGRQRLLCGIKDTWILDDTYNAAPASVHAALDTLKELPGKRKIAVLGDMLELGKFTEVAHRAVGERAAADADILITVGDRMRFAADEAISRGIDEMRVKSFSATYDAGRALQEVIEPGDCIVVKGSRALHMEKIVLEIMAEPERAEELLVSGKK